MESPFLTELFFGRGEGGRKEEKDGSFFKGVEEAS